MLLLASSAAAFDRKYTVSEIDRLRYLVEQQWLFGSYCRIGSAMSRSYNEAEKVKSVEEIVRTYMLAGVTADDLLEKCNPTN